MKSCRVILSKLGALPYFRVLIIGSILSIMIGCSAELESHAESQTIKGPYFDKYEQLAASLSALNASEVFCDPQNLERGIEKKLALRLEENCDFDAFLDTLIDFVNSGTYITTFFPEFPNSALAYATTLAKRTSIDYATLRLSTLKMMAQDEESKFGKCIEHIVSFRYSKAILTLVLLDLSNAGAAYRQEIDDLKEEEYMVSFEAK